MTLGERIRTGLAAVLRALRSSAALALLTAAACVAVCGGRASAYQTH